MFTVRSPDGVAIAVHELGGGDGPPGVDRQPDRQGNPQPDRPGLLVAHATGFHGRVYQPMVDAGLSDRFRCVAPDLRGHGDSPASVAQVGDWHRFGADVAAVAAAMGAPPAGLYGFGHSMGGAALVLAELAHPGTFAGLWLFEPILPPPVAFPAGSPNPLADGAERRREVFDSFEAAIANFSSKPPMDVFTPAAMRAYVEHGFRPEPDGTVRLKCPGAVEAATFRGASTHHAFTRLGEVACPTAFGVGRLDLGSPAAFAEPAAASMPHAWVEHFDHLGHFAPQEAPEEIAAAVLHFFLTQ